jgi:glutamine amidotransferase
MLTYLAPGVQPDLDALARGAELNDHGHGFAIVANNRIVVRKDKDSAKLLDLFAQTRRLHPEGPALFHSRFATHGAKSKANMHPYHVGHDRRTVVAHNGVLPRSVHPKPGDSRSDTRVFAEDRLGTKPFADFDTTATKERLESWLGFQNKVLILTVDPRYANQAYLFNEDSGFWHNDVWYSNADFCDAADLESPFIWARDEICPACESGAPDPDTGLCELCASCVECGESPDQCSKWCGRCYMFDSCTRCGDFLCSCTSHDVMGLAM